MKLEGDTKEKVAHRWGNRKAVTLEGEVKKAITTASAKRAVKKRPRGGARSPRYAEPPRANTPRPAEARIPPVAAGGILGNSLSKGASNCLREV
jgi:hypothetical protein